MSLLATAATVAAVASALAFYGATPQRHWPWLARVARRGAVVGAALAAASLGAWIVLLGVGAGLSVALSVWMIAAVALPWIALATRDRTVDRTGRA